LLVRQQIPYKYTVFRKAGEAVAGAPATTRGPQLPEGR